MGDVNELTISIKAARVNANKTQQEVADMLGLSVQSYRKKEKGDRKFYIDEVVKLSAFFGIDFKFFFETQCNKKTQEQT